MSQNPIALPTTGTVSGTELVTLVNQALDTLNTVSSGASAPTAPEAYQLWQDTSTSPPTLRQYDGASWVALGILDTTNHLWLPPIGGGSTTIASASSCDLGSKPQSFLQITGTTTINDFGSSMKPGQVKIVEFAGALTLANSSNLILPGAASVTTAAGDMAIVACTAAGTPNVCRVIYMLASGQALVTPSPSSSMPTGALSPFAGSSAPTGWLLCYGQAVSRTTYATLYSTISTTYGSGDGSTTFNLPDLRGRAAFGIDNMGGTAASRVTSGGSGISGSTAGATGGAETVTLTTAQMPSHGHSYTAGGGATSVYNGSSKGAPSTVGTPGSGSSTGGAGSGSAHNNMPPAILLNYIIKT